MTPKVTLPAENKLPPEVPVGGRSLGRVGALQQAAALVGVCNHTAAQFASVQSVSTRKRYRAGACAR